MAHRTHTRSRVWTPESLTEVLREVEMSELSPRDRDWFGRVQATVFDPLAEQITAHPAQCEQPVRLHIGQVEIEFNVMNEETEKRTAEALRKLVAEVEVLLVDFN